VICHPNTRSAYTARGLPRSSQSNPNEVIGKPEAPATLRHAYDYGYSDSNSLNSMGMLTKVHGSWFSFLL
jgi:hypothetical protein